MHSELRDGRRSQSSIKLEKEVKAFPSILKVKKNGLINGKLL